MPLETMLQAPPPPPVPPPVPRVVFGITSINVPVLEVLPPLHEAAKAGDLPSLMRLLGPSGCKLACDPDALHDGESALHLAAVEGQHAACALLLERGATLTLANAKLAGTICTGWLPVHGAAQSESPETLALLLARGAEVHARTRIGVTPLHVAAFNGRLASTKLLVSRRADVHARDKDGFTPLSNAQHRLRDCPCQVEDRLAEWGAVISFLERVTPMAPEERRDCAARSWALHVASRLLPAAEQSHLAELAQLLECFVSDVDAADVDGAAASHAAALAGHADVLSLLLSRGATVDLRTNLGETPLHFAAREGHLVATSVLVKRGASVNATTKFGATALALASRGQNREWLAVTALLEAQG